MQWSYILVVQYDKINNIYMYLQSQILPIHAN